MVAKSLFNLYRTFVESLDTSDAPFKQTILETLDIMIEAESQPQGANPEPEDKKEILLGWDDVNPYEKDKPKPKPTPSPECNTLNGRCPPPKLQSPLNTRQGPEPI